MSWEQLLGALLVGILGGVHCLSMCGGVVGALTFSLPSSVQQARWRMGLYQFFYNLGRISSYVLMGGILGYLGASVVSLVSFLPLQRALQVLAGVFMIALGLYLAGIWQGVVVIEQAGGKLWRRLLQPLVQKLTPVRSLPQAYLYGAVWGWLPCGLVYSMLIWALSAGSALNGAAVMLAFGLGTLPNLMLMGVFAFYFTLLARNIWVRRGSGLLVVIFGVYQLYTAWIMQQMM